MKSKGGEQQEMWLEREAITSFNCSVGSGDSLKASNGGLHQMCVLEKSSGYISVECGFNWASIWTIGLKSSVCGPVSQGYIGHWNQVGT